MLTIATSSQALRTRRINRQTYDRIVSELDFGAWAVPIVFECIPIDMFGSEFADIACGKHIAAQERDGDYWPGDWRIDEYTPVYDPRKCSPAYIMAMLHQAQIDMDGEYFVLPIPASWVV